jgi:hypothetical protein
VCVCVGFVMCVCVGFGCVGILVICTCILVFTMFLYCFVSVILICSLCTSVRTTATE